MNIDSMTLQELKALHKDVQRAIASYEARQRAAATAELEARAKELGFTLAELLGTAPVKSKTRVPVAPKYRNPKNPEETWTGRGRPPRWLAVALTSVGAKLEDFAI
jgi:DNA-binding protein H-NS